MKISKKELKQIIVESLQEEDLDEGIMDKIKGAYGAAKGALSGTKATDSPAEPEEPKPAGKPFPGSKGSPEYQAALMRAATQKHGKEKAERLYGKATDAEPAAANTPAEEPAAADTPAAAEAKPQINVFRGKGGKGVQSQMAKAGVKGKDIGRVLKGLKSDLAGAGFEVLEELAEAKRREISIVKTLAAIGQIADPEQKEAVKKIIVKLLKQHKVKVSDPRLGRAKPAKAAAKPAAAPAAKPAAKPAAAPAAKPATPAPAKAPEEDDSDAVTEPSGRPAPLPKKKGPTEEEKTRDRAAAAKKKKVRKKAQKSKKRNRKKKRGFEESQELSEGQISRFAIIAGLIKGE